MNNLVFLPVKGISRRVPKKNFRKVGDYEFGLLEIKLKQLMKCCNVDQLFISSEEQRILDISKKIIENDLGNKKIHYHLRDPKYAGDCATDELIKHAIADTKDINYKNFIWTHVTSPFLNSEKLFDLIQEAEAVIASGVYDSFMTVNKIQNFVYFSGSRLNFGKELKWPRTQDLEPVYEINSGLFFISKERLEEFGDRVGHFPYLKELEQHFNLDIDWPEDFARFQKLANLGIKI